MRVVVVDFRTAIAGRSGLLSSDLDSKNGRNSETLFFTMRLLEILLLLKKAKS